ncbi:HNH endonuclease [Haloglomus salinum]|uniref:HNH endonuclease n=1 Tax=Haloglomus salinum TaxID=2962673 RepID=UPI0020C96CA0|nr:HNH endonuclease [Haloglomus salinum]
MGRAYRVGETYRDTGSYRKSEDQFLRWIRGPLDSGIRNTGGIRDIGADHSDSPAALVLVSNDKGVSQHDDPWEDTLAVDSGYISYWGDAKEGNPYDDSDQNDKVVDAFDRAAAGRREEVPPVLVFRKPESGVVQFCGLCVPDYLEARPYRDDDGNRVPNYLFHFTILNTPEVPVEWLHSRARGGSNEAAPDEWETWTRTGEVHQWPTGVQREQNEGWVRRYEQAEIPVSEDFRQEAFERYGRACVITDIREEPVLDLAHVLPRSERPDLAEHSENVLVLNSLHHRAFDADLFTIDPEMRLRVSPAFDPGHPFLRETIVEREGEEVRLPPDASVRGEFLEELNGSLSWV